MKLLTVLALVVAFVRDVLARLLGRQRGAAPETTRAMAEATARAEEAKAEVTAQTAAEVAPHMETVEAVAAEVEAAQANDREKRRAALRALTARVNQ